MRPGGGRLLTTAEREVLQAYAVLGDTRQVASQLRRSRRTVEHVLESVRRKLEVATTTQAVGIAIKSGLIPGPPGRP